MESVDIPAQQTVPKRKPSLKATVIDITDDDEEDLDKPESDAKSSEAELS